MLFPCSTVTVVGIVPSLLGLIGLALLLLAVSPCELRPDDFTPDIDPLFALEEPLAPDEALAALHRQPSESDSEFVYRTTDVMHRAIAHHWPDARTGYNARVPLRENYLLWTLSFVPTGKWEHFKKYAFWDYEKAVQRGFGLCRQYAQAMFSFFESQDLDVVYLALDGHVVVQVNLREETLIVDSDYGVIIPHSIDDIRGNPAIVREYYESSPRISVIADRFATLDDMESNYEPPYSKANPEQQIFLEKLSYTLIFGVPIALLGIAFLGFL